MTASGVCAGVCLTLTLLAALARSTLSSLEYASTAEGNEAYMWANPLMVSLSTCPRRADSDPSAAYTS